MACSIERSECGAKATYSTIFPPLGDLLFETENVVLDGIVGKPKNCPAFLNEPASRKVTVRCEPCGLLFVAEKPAGTEAEDKALLGNLAIGAVEETHSNLLNPPALPTSI
jgi:hypothetical protein